MNVELIGTVAVTVALTITAIKYLPGYLAKKSRESYYRAGVDSELAKLTLELLEQGMSKQQVMNCLTNIHGNRRKADNFVSRHPELQKAILRGAK